MLLNFHSFTADEEFFNMKAPQGFAYLVETIHFEVVTYTEVASLVRSITQIFDFETAETFDDNLRSSIAGFTFTSPANSTAGVGNDQNLVVTNINHETKYISGRIRMDQTVTTNVRIYGRLIKMSKVDEIWEFITKATI